MKSAATRALNSTVRSLDSLEALARAKPTEAVAFVKHARALFEETGRRLPAATSKLLGKVLAGAPGGLARRLQANAAGLASLFADAPSASWATLQAQRAQTIGWTGSETPALRSLTGELDATGTSITTAAGSVYSLATSPRQGSSGVPAGWVGGFRDDADHTMTVRGTMAADGKTFLVEDFCPGSSDQYVSGRYDGAGHVQTTRGPVTITSAALRAQLLNTLGVILPGPTSVRRGETIYSGAPKRSYNLGRFDNAVAATEGQAVAAAQQQVANAQAMLTQARAQAQQVATSLAQSLAQISTLQSAAKAARARALALVAPARAALKRQVDLGDALAAANTALVAAAPRSAAAPSARRQSSLAAAQAKAAAALAASDSAAAAGAAAAQALADAQAQVSAASAQVTQALAMRTSSMSQVTQLAQQVSAAESALTEAQASLASAEAAARPGRRAAKRVIARSGVFANNLFRGPINLHGTAVAARANNTDRIWLLGYFVKTAAGGLTSFEADYVSLPLGSGTLPGAAFAETDDWAAAVALTQAGEGPRRSKPVGADYARRNG